MKKPLTIEEQSISAMLSLHGLLERVRGRAPGDSVTLTIDEVTGLLFCISDLMADLERRRLT